MPDTLLSFHLKSNVTSICLSLITHTIIDPTILFSISDTVSFTKFRYLWNYSLIYVFTWLEIDYVICLFCFVFLAFKIIHFILFLLATISNEKPIIIFIFFPLQVKFSLTSLKKSLALAFWHLKGVDFLIFKLLSILWILLDLCFGVWL